MKAIDKDNIDFKGFTDKPEYNNCNNCGHSLSNHVGSVYMGFGESETLGCTFVEDLEKGILCDCPLSPEGLDS